MDMLRDCQSEGTLLQGLEFLGSGFFGFGGPKFKVEYHVESPILVHSANCGRGVQDWSAPLFTQVSDNSTAGPKMYTNPQTQKSLEIPRSNRGEINKY